MTTPSPHLTSREQEVLILAGRALSNRQIARSLDISEKTVKNHLGSVYAKLDATCRIEALLIAHRQGLAVFGEDDRDPVRQESR